MIGRYISRVPKFIFVILGLIMTCGIGGGIFYIVDISNYIFPDSSNIKIKPQIDLSSTSRVYCDANYAMMNLGWSATNLPEKSDEIQVYYSEILTKKFGNVQDLDNRSAYPIVSYWIPLANSKYFFADVKKVFFGAGIANPDSAIYIYGVETRIYVGIYPKINNSCPNKR